MECTLQELSNNHDQSLIFNFQRCVADLDRGTIGFSAPKLWDCIYTSVQTLLTFCILVFWKPILGSFRQN